MITVYYKIKGVLSYQTVMPEVVDNLVKCLERNIHVKDIRVGKDE